MPDDKDTKRQGWDLHDGKQDRKKEHHAAGGVAAMIGSICQRCGTGFPPA
jgi:hypothetical protein